MAPILVDICCGAGGASVGYKNAGFDIIGIDLYPQPDYPFKFIQMDIRNLTIERILKLNPSFIHTSPPCQPHSSLTKGTNQGMIYADHLEFARELCKATLIPYVIENVQSAPLKHDLILCGEMFGLDVIRHRIFEFGNIYPVNQIPHKQHRGRVEGWRHGIWYPGPYKAVYGDGGGKGSIQEWQMAMGINWTNNRKSIAEAIPPAYTTYIGQCVMKSLLDTRQDHAVQ